MDTKELPWMEQTSEVFHFFPSFSLFAKVSQKNVWKSEGMCLRKLCSSCELLVLLLGGVKSSCTNKTL